MSSGVFQSALMPWAPGLGSWEPGPYLGKRLKEVGNAKTSYSIWLIASYV